MSLIKSVDMVAKVGLFRPAVAKETLENKMRRLRREYCAEQVRSIAMNKQAMLAIRINLQLDAKRQERINWLEMSNEVLRNVLTEKVED